MTPALAYRVLDAQDRDVTDASNPPTTIASARRVARFHGTGARVVGARGQTIYVVPAPEKRGKSK